MFEAGTVTFTIGPRTFDVPVPMVLLSLKAAWPFVQAVGTAQNGVESAEAACGAVSAGLILADHRPSQHELMATLTADQIPALLVSFGELMRRCGLEFAAPGETKAGPAMAQTGTPSSPNSPSPGDSKAAASAV